METTSHLGLRILSPELFGLFFSIEASVTERIINTILDTDFHIDRVWNIGGSEEIFSFYHPFVLVDAHTRSGRTALALTLIDEDTRDATEDILNWILSRVMVKRRNIYPIILVFDLTSSFPFGDRSVHVRIIEGRAVSFTLAVAYVKNRKDKTLSDLFSDLLMTIPEKIGDDEIRKLYFLSFRKSGLEEKRIVSYSCWLESLRRDIAAAGGIPEF